MPDEGAQETEFVLEGTRMAAPCGGERGNFGAGQVGERVGLQVAPQVFDRVQFRGVGRKVKVPPLHHVEEDLGVETAMDIGSIPEQQQRITKVTGKLPEKPPHGRRSEVRIDQ